MDISEQSLLDLVIDRIVISARIAVFLSNTFRPRPGNLPGITEEYGKTPLHEAAKMGHLETVQLLIAVGADVNPEECQGYTPLHRAAEESDVQLHTDRLYGSE